MLKFCKIESTNISSIENSHLNSIKFKIKVEMISKIVQFLSIFAWLTSWIEMLCELPAAAAGQKKKKKFVTGASRFGVCLFFLSTHCDNIQFVSLTHLIFRF